MSDAQVSTEIDSPQQPLTAGAMLRSAREAAGLHIAALAVSMKVSVKKLEALEQDRVDPLLEPVFVRALACSVCRALKIDPGPVLEKLPQNQIPRLSTLEVGKNAPFRATGQNPGVFASTNFAKPSFFLVPVLLVGVAALLLLPENKTADILAGADGLATPSVLVPAAPEVITAKTEAVDVVSSAVTTSTVSASPTVTLAPAMSDIPAAAPTTAPIPTPAPLASVETKPVPERTTSPSATSRANLLVFKAKGASWVEVVDGTGVVQVRKILAAGETVPIFGALPLAVVVGRTDAVDIEVRGKAFDLSNISKDGVARFEVK